MADRARNAERHVAELEDKLSESVKDYEAAHAVAEEKDAEIAKLKAQLKQKEAQIHEMENTKVWKLYRSIKKQ